MDVEAISPKSAMAQSRCGFAAQSRSAGLWEGLPLLLLVGQLEGIMRSPFIFGGHLYASGKGLLAFGAPHSTHWQSDVIQSLETEPFTVNSN